MNDEDRTPQGLPPAGWYPDPETEGVQRYWDGQAWADQLQPSPTRAEPRPEHQATIAAGWYFDPEVQGGQRYWDGQRWTDDRRPPGARAQAQPGAATAPPRPGSAARPWFGLNRTVGLVILGLVAAGVVVAIIVSSGGDEGTSQGSFGLESQQAQDINGDSITEADEQHWVDVWCTLSPGMSREDVYTAMGAPTTEFTQSDTSAQPQASWEAGNYHFTVFFDSGDGASQYYINPLEADASLRAAIDCPLTR